MTIDEAIIYHVQKADSYHKAMPNYDEAADHRQLAEWLTELKEAKRLLKAAVATFNDASCNKDCCQCKWNNEGCEIGCRFAWIHTDEALKLIEKGENDEG